MDRVDVCKRVIAANGDCAGIACSDCPLFYIKNPCSTPFLGRVARERLILEAQRRWLHEMEDLEVEEGLRMLDAYEDHYSCTPGDAMPPALETPKAKRHQELLDGLHETFVRKNHDYGDSFSVTFKEFGIISFIVRAQDKWNRIKSLSMDGKSAKVAESLQDTLLDLANYCIMASMELEAKDGD